MNKIILTGFLTFAVLMVRAADEAQPSLPTGTVLLRAPQFAHWKITYTYDAPATPAPVAPPLPEGVSPPPPPVLPQEISVTKTGKIYHSELKVDNGSDIDQWWVDGVGVVEQKGQSGHSLLSGQAAVTQGFQGSDFPDLDWINRSSFSGVEVVDGAKCFVFKRQVLVTPDELGAPASQDGHDPRPTFEMTVWVNVESRLPVRESEPGFKTDYHFLAPPDSPLDPPQEITQILSANRAEFKKLTTPARRP